MRLPFLLTFCTLFPFQTFACDSTQIKLDSTWIGPGPYPGFVIDFNCHDSNLILQFLDPIKSSSVNTMGENFFILTPSNDTVFAIETEIDTSAYGLDSTKLLNIKFSNPLVQNGSYILVIKPNDQNIPIENICGAQWLSDSITISVTNCINLVQVENEPNEKWIVNEKQWGVNLSNESELTLIDLNGRLVYSQMLTNGFNEIPQDALPQGMYMAAIDGRFSRKLFKL